MGDLLHPQGNDQDETPETPMDPGDFVLAMSAEDQVQAQLLVAACEEAEIPSILQSPRSGPVGTIASPVEAFNILVPQRDLGRALQLLRDTQAALDADPEGAARAAEEEEESEKAKP